MGTQNRTSRAFARYNNAALLPFASNVVTQMTNNTNFQNPLVPLPDISAAIDALSTAVEASLNGGRLEMADRNAKHAVLVALLRQQAAYVEAVAADDLTVLLSSGFEAVSTNRAQIPLPKPVILRIDNLATSQLGIRALPVSTAKAYEAQARTGTGEWVTVGIFTKARLMVLENLISGALYDTRVRAIGGSTGTSDWSDPMSHRVL